MAGWNLCKRNNIAFGVQSGEEGQVNKDTCKQWKEKLPSLIEGYAPRDIFNMDETGMFFRGSNKKTFMFKGEECKGGKMSKERITVALCANMLGEKEPPIVIGKSLKPRCFSSINPASLPVKYHALAKPG
jgi:hypothetical protein